MKRKTGRVKPVLAQTLATLGTFVSNGVGNTWVATKRAPKKRETKPQVLQAIYGPLNGPIQTTPRAELEAIALVLQYALPPICIVSDHKNHVEAFNRGRKHCCKMMSPMIDIWLRIWQRVDRSAFPVTRSGTKRKRGRKEWIEEAMTKRITWLQKGRAQHEISDWCG